MIDCGENWLKKLKRLQPTSIFITHAHPDHAFGLKEGSFCPVYATKITFDLLKDFPIEKKYKKIVTIGKKTKIDGITFEPFEVMHSIKAPAVGYRITFNKKAFFYVPDVLWIENRKKAFKNILFYIGDGATIKRVMVRKDKKTNQLYGHANISSQLTWCQKENVKKMIITHCGSDIVKNEIKAKKEIIELAQKKGVEAILAYDGMTLEI
ncbi:MAG: MBL fold metallo-hydrolase [Parachlamydiales bacterium]|nr:MBL fold metallo-hydrolase [Parachlamydiales bacterium]